MARTQLITVLLRKGIRNHKGPHAPNGRRLVTLADAQGRPVKPVDTGVTLTDTSANNDANGQEPARGSFMIALGAVSCHFKKEIKPYERFEIWTRILTWDKKWVYVISHMVKDGVVMPDEYALQPYESKLAALRKAKKSKRSGKGAEGATEAEKRAEWKKAIFATSISKYVVKKGRLTISPEVVFQNSDLLPPKPDDAEAAAKVAAEMPHWTWERVEEERLRGLEIANHFAALDAEGGLHDEFPLARERDGEAALKLDTLGVFKDLML